MLVFNFLQEKSLFWQGFSSRLCIAIYHTALARYPTKLELGDCDHSRIPNITTLQRLTKSCKLIKATEIIKLYFSRWNQLDQVSPILNLRRKK